MPQPRGFRQGRSAVVPLTRRPVPLPVGSARAGGGLSEADGSGPPRERTTRIRRGRPVERGRLRGPASVSSVRTVDVLTAGLQLAAGYREASASRSCEPASASGSGALANGHSWK